MDEKRFDEYDEFQSERGFDEFDDSPLVRGFDDDDASLTSDFSGGSFSWDEDSPLTSDFSGGGSSWDEDSPLTSDFSRGSSGWDEDSPLTSDFSGGGSSWQDDDEPLDIGGDDTFDTRPVVRPAGRRETIEQLASDHKKGIVRTPGMRTQPDPRLAASRLGKLGDPYAKKQPPRRTNPGGNGVPRQGNGKPPPGGRGGSPPPVPPPPSAYKRRKTIFAAFYIVMILMAVGVCVTVFLVVFQNVMNDPPSAIGASPTPTPTPMVGVNDRADIRNQTALVTDIDPFGGVRTLTLMDVGTRHSAEFLVPEEARISNRNMPMAFAELRVGHVVDVGFDIRTSEIVNLSISTHSWERRNRTNVQIDLEEALITVGNETFNFNSHTLVLHRGEQFHINQIRPIDSVTLVGTGDTAWLVQLDAAHGFLQFSNADLVINGTLRVGTSRFYRLEDIENALELPEGTHQIIVEGSNIEQFITNVTIEQGQTETINLGDAELRAALLHIHVTPADAIIIIDGQVHDQAEGPAHVEFGEVRIRVEQDGFVPMEETIEVTMPVQSMMFNLVEIIIESVLVVTTVPSNAEIFVDNVRVGYSPVTYTIDPGSYRIIARMPGFEDVVLNNITIPAGETIAQHLLLSPVPTPSIDHWNPQQSPQPTQPPPGHPLPEIPSDNPFPDSPPTLPPPELIQPQPDGPPTYSHVEPPPHQQPPHQSDWPSDVTPSDPIPTPVPLPEEPIATPPPVPESNLPEVPTDNPFAGGHGTP